MLASVLLVDAAMVGALLVVLIAAVLVDTLLIDAAVVETGVAGVVLVDVGPVGGVLVDVEPPELVVGAATTSIVAEPTSELLLVSVIVNFSEPAAPTVTWKEAMPLVNVSVAGTATPETEQATVAVPE